MWEYLLGSVEFVWCAMAVIIFIATQIIKLPIKACTNLIKNERARRIVNATILLIPFALGIVLEFLYSTYWLGTTFSIINGLGYGTAGISLYGVVERFFKVKTRNPYDSEEGKAVTDLVDQVSKDGKVTESDGTAVKEFLDKVSK